MAALLGVLLACGAARAQEAGANAGDPLPFCLTCHGEQGLAQRPAAPDLARQPVPYLDKQLADFRRESRALLIERNETGNRTGQRDHPDMHAYAGLLDDPDERRALVARLAERACHQAQPAKGAAAPALFARCAACHGEDAKSPLSVSIPRLAGQSRAYLAAQMNAMQKAKDRDDNRASALTLRSHPIMNAQVAALSTADIRALAVYLAQLPCQ